MLKEMIERIEALGKKSDSEENLKYFITVWMLQKLGYDDSLFDFEHPLCRDSKNNKHADIFIQVENGRAMFVETKKYSKTLSDEDVFQLAQYITLHHEIAWGILTNGRQMFLINNSIDIYGNDKKSILNKLVLNVEFNPINGQFTNGEYIKYFSKESIYESCVTNFYKAVAQFFAKHSLQPSSEEQYRNTLWRFFDYYISKGNRYSVYGAREYAPLESITDKDFVDFLKNASSSTKQSTGKVPLSKCAHIISMYNIMESNGYIYNNTMKNVRNRAIAEFDENTIVESSEEILTEENITTILGQLEDKPHKVVIFILAAYYGFTREQIGTFLALKWENIDFKKHTFYFGDRSYPLIKTMENNLIKMLDDYRNKGLRKPSAIYVVKKNGSYGTVGTDTINDVFRNIKNNEAFEGEDVLFNPQVTRASAIRSMLCAGCSIEEISYITGAPLSQLIRYFPDEIVLKNGQKKWNAKGGGKDRHPFGSIFD